MHFFENFALSRPNSDILVHICLFLELESISM
jgi:hypothetical protein